MKRMDECEFFGSIVQIMSVAADDFTARNPGHFLEDPVHKENLTWVVGNDNTVIQCSRMGSICWSQCGVSLTTKYLFSLVRCTRACAALSRLTPETIKHVLDIHIAGDKVCALAAHGSLHSFPTLVDERDFVEVHYAPPPWG